MNEKKNKRAISGIVTCLAAVFIAAFGLILTGLFGGSVAAKAENSGDYFVVELDLYFGDTKIDTLTLEGSERLTTVPVPGAGIMYTLYSYELRGDVAEYEDACYDNFDLVFDGVKGDNSYWEFFYENGEVGIRSLGDNQVSAAKLQKTLTDAGAYVSCEFIREPVELPETPIKEGHTFAGWYYGSQAQHGENCTAYNGEPIYEDTALHAHFNINRYTVTYNTLGGTPVDKITVDWNTSLNCPVPTKTGYDFAGWYLPDGTLYVNQPIKTNTTLTAKWQVKIFTVTFYIEGENGNETYKTIDVPYGSTLGKAMEDAEIISYKVMSQEGVRVSKESIITEDTAALVEKLSGWEKYGDFVARNEWYTWLIAGIGVALIITATVAIIVAVKRR